MLAMLFFYNIFICVIIGEIISDEINTGSIYYLIIKQKNIRKVLEIKTISCILLTFSILAFNIFSISMFGLFTKEIEPLVVLGNINEVILKDDCINESIFRITFFNINLLFGIVIITLLSVIVSIFARNKISSIISSFIVIMIATYPINIKGKVYSLIFYKLPLIKLYIPITDYVKYITSNIVIYILVIFILSLFVNLSWRLRNEL